MPEVNVINIDSPFLDQKPGTSGLRKSTLRFQEEHYLEIFIEAILQSLEDIQGSILVVGGDGRYGNLEAIEKIPVHPKRARNIPKSIHNELMRASKDLKPNAISNTYIETLISANIMGVVKNNVRPALMLWGTKEKRFQKLGEWAKKNIPLLQIVELDTGHGVNMEKSDDFDKGLGNFIQKTLKGRVR